MDTTIVKKKKKKKEMLVELDMELFVNNCRLPINVLIRESIVLKMFDLCISPYIGRMCIEHYIRKLNRGRLCLLLQQKSLITYV